MARRTPAEDGARAAGGRGSRLPARRRRTTDGPSPLVFYGLVVMLTALFVVAAWATIEEPNPPGPVARVPSSPTAPPTPTAAPSASPTAPPTLSPTVAVIVVERRPPTQTPRPSATPTAAPSVTPPIALTPTQTVTSSPIPPTATQTPTETPPPPAPTPTEASTIYTVKPGDTLISIGQQFGVPWQAIAAANGLPEDTVLRVDQQLVIPRPS